MKNKIWTFLVAGGILLTPAIVRAEEVKTPNPTPQKETVTQITKESVADVLAGKTITLDITEKAVFDALKDTSYNAINDKIVAKLKAILVSNGITEEQLTENQLKVMVDISENAFNGIINKTDVIVTKTNTSVHKEINIEYSNTGALDETAKNTIDTKLKALNFNKFVPRNIGEDYEPDLEEITNDVKKLLNDDTFEVVVIQNNQSGGDGVIWDNSFTALFFIKDQLYASQKIDYVEVNQIVIPANISKDKEDAYVIEKMNEYFKEYWEAKDNIAAGYKKINALPENFEFSATSDNLYQVEFTKEYGKGWSVFMISKGTYSKVEGTDKIEIAADNHDNLSVKSEELSEDSEDYKEFSKILTEKGYKNIFGIYDLTATGSLNGKLTIAFNVGKDNDGKSAMVLHKKHDGTIENFESVVKDGYVYVEVEELSPFSIALKDAAKDEAPNNIQTSSMNTLLYGAIATVSLGGVLLLCKKKRHLDK